MTESIKIVSYKGPLYFLFEKYYKDLTWVLMFDSVHSAEQIQEQFYSQHFTSIIHLSSNVWADLFSDLGR